MSLTTIITTANGPFFFSLFRQVCVVDVFLQDGSSSCCLWCGGDCYPGSFLCPCHVRHDRVSRFLPELSLSFSAACSLRQVIQCPSPGNLLSSIQLAARGCY